MSEMIGRLRVALGLETAAFERGARRAQGDLRSLGDRAEAAGFKIGSMAKVLYASAAAFAGGAFVTKLFEITKAGLDYASSLVETASQLGVTTQSLQQYRYIATQVGLEQGEMDQALARLTRTLGEASAGAKAQAAVFKTLQISVRDANGHVKEAGAVIPEIAEALKRIPDPAQRAAILVDIFGKAGQKLAPLMESGASGVNELRDAAERLGVVLSDEQIQRADETADKLSELTTILNAKIAGTVADNTQAIIKLANGLGWLADKAGDAAFAWSQIPYMLGRQSFGDFVKDTYGGVELTFTPEELAERKRQEQWKRGRLGGSSVRVPMANWPSARTGGILNPGGSAYTGLGSQKYSPSDFAKRQSFVAPKPAPKVRSTPQKSDIKLDLSGGGGGTKFHKSSGGAAKAAAQDAEKLAQAMQKLSVWGGDASKAIGAANDNLVKFSDRAGPALDRVPPAFDAAKLKAGEFADKLAELQSRLFPEIDAMAKYRAELDLITRALEQNRISAEQAAEWRHRLAMEGRSTETAISIIMADAGPEVDMERIGEGLDSLYDRMRGFRDKSGAITVQVAQSFKDMADDTLRSLNDLANSIRGGDFLSIFTSVVNLGLQLAGAGAFGSDLQSKVNSIPGRAWGGQINAGQMYMVGERGPELFISGSNGSIVPNHRMATGPGGGGNTYYVSGNLLTPEFWQKITAQDMQAAQAGGELGYRKVLTKSRRRLA